MYYFCLKAEDKLKAEEEIPDADEENTIADGRGEDVKSKGAPEQYYFMVPKNP